MSQVEELKTTLKRLEEIERWKRREEQQTAELLRDTPQLEPQLAGVLREWGPLLQLTSRYAASWREARRLQPADREALTAARADWLLGEAVKQSREWTRQLEAILGCSAALQTQPETAERVQRFILESGETVAKLAGSASSDAGSDGTIAGSAAAAKPSQQPAEVREATAHPASAAVHAPGEPDAAAAFGAPASADSTARKPVGAKPVKVGVADSSSRAEGPSDNAGSADAPPQMPDYKPVPIGGHTLPPLPYAYNALEPHIDEKTMRIHHDIHHKSYVDGLNKAEKELEKARKTGNFELVKHWERELAFNGAGHYLHTLFWMTMSPVGGGSPPEPLAAQLTRDFGSVKAFREQFSQAAEKVEGGGWAILVWSPRSGRLEILQAEKHQNLSQWDVIPILPLDVWEHAYYLKHQNKRADYIKDWWNVVNWPFVNERFVQASQLKWTPF
ncbi:Fe-Mn family superoxide dismutase [Paenibacillus sp. 1P07SE]|uniref:superoxide dismutase n=1 Tax=Paenibacillus sp. 1P07SE TaxID=3132209 RepID=UPI0039A7492A